MAPFSKPPRDPSAGTSGEKSSPSSSRSGDAHRRRPVVQRTPEELVLAMTQEELLELMGDLGFEPSTADARNFVDLVTQYDSLDAAIVALHDAKVARRAA